MKAILFTIFIFLATIRLFAVERAKSNQSFEGLASVEEGADLVNRTLLVSLLHGKNLLNLEVIRVVTTRQTEYRRLVGVEGLNLSADFILNQGASSKSFQFPYFAKRFDIDPYLTGSIQLSYSDSLSEKTSIGIFRHFNSGVDFYDLSLVTYPALEDYLVASKTFPTNSSAREAAILKWKEKTIKYYDRVLSDVDLLERMRRRRPFKLPEKLSKEELAVSIVNRALIGALYYGANKLNQQEERWYEGGHLEYDSFDELVFYTEQSGESRNTFNIPYDLEVIYLNRIGPFFVLFHLGDPIDPKSVLKPIVGITFIDTYFDLKSLVSQEKEMVLRELKYLSGDENEKDEQVDAISWKEMKRIDLLLNSDFARKHSEPAFVQVLEQELESGYDQKKIFEHPEALNNFEQAIHEVNQILLLSIFVKDNILGLNERDRPLLPKKDVIETLQSHPLFRYLMRINSYEGEKYKIYATGFCIMTVYFGKPLSKDSKIKPIVRIDTNKKSYLFGQVLSGLYREYERQIEKSANDYETQLAYRETVLVQSIEALDAYLPKDQDNLREEISSGKESHIIILPDGQTSLDKINQEFREKTILLGVLLGTPILYNLAQYIYSYVSDNVYTWGELVSNLSEAGVLLSGTSYIVYRLSRLPGDSTGYVTYSRANDPVGFQQRLTYTKDQIVDVFKKFRMSIFRKKSVESKCEDEINK